MEASGRPGAQGHCNINHTRREMTFAHGSFVRAEGFILIYVLAEGFSVYIPCRAVTWEASITPILSLQQLPSLILVERTRLL